MKKLAVWGQVKSSQSPQQLDHSCSMAYSKGTAETRDIPVGCLDALKSLSSSQNQSKSDGLEGSEVCIRLHVRVSHPVSQCLVVYFEGNVLHILDWCIIIISCTFFAQNSWSSDLFISTEVIHVLVLKILCITIFMIVTLCFTNSGIYGL